MHCLTYMLFFLQLPLRKPQDLSNKRLSKKNKTVHRVYGGHLSHAVVRERCAWAWGASVRGAWAVRLLMDGYMLMAPPLRAGSCVLS